MHRECPVGPIVLGPVGMPHVPRQRAPDAAAEHGARHDLLDNGVSTGAPGDARADHRQPDRRQRALSLHKLRQVWRLLGDHLLASCSAHEERHEVRCCSHTARVSAWPRTSILCP